jgi:hypothetical protein
MELGQTTLTAGFYSQIRLLLVSNKSVPMSNTVTPTATGVETEMDTPSATQSGLKLINGFTVAPDQLTDVVLDFDACKSVVTRGNGSFGLKPVIKVTPRALGEIVGYVEKGVSGVTVSAQTKDGVVIRATAPDPVTGKFTLSLLDPVLYDVVFTAKDRTTAVIASVPAGSLPTRTILNSSDPPSPVTMPPSASGAVSGLLLPLAAAATDGAQVRALQTVGTVLRVEVAFTTTFSATTGAYSLSLPVAAPRLATWSNPMVNPIPFTPQAADAAEYKLEASAPGYMTSALKDAIAPSASNDFLLVVAP